MDHAIDVFVDHAGRVTVVGGAAKRDAGRSVWAMARFKTDGSLDGSFGDGGKLLRVVPFHGAAYRVARRPGGGYYVAGQIRRQGDFGYAIAAVNDDGSLDTTWGDSGTVTWLGDRKRYPYELTVADDGSIVLLTTASDGLESHLPAVVTYAADGTFVSEVVGQQPRVYFFDDIVRLPGGGFVTAAQGGRTGDGWSVQVAAFNPDGSPDTGFGTDGVAQHPFARHNNFVTAVSAGGHGRLLVAGAFGPKVGDVYGWGVMRLLPSGALDRSFGSGGVVRVRGSRAFSIVNQVQRLPDGKILAIGQWNGKLRLMQFNSDGSVTKTFQQIRYSQRSSGGAIAIDAHHVYAAGSRIRSAWDQSMLVVTSKR